jgi:hypothetical protein
MSDSTNPLDQVSQTAIQRETTINALLDAASPATLFGRRASTCTGLTWGYYGGRLDGATVANGTVLATASNTNYVVFNRSTLAVTIATSTTNWNNLATYGRLYKLTAGASSITSYEDHRAGAGGAALVPKVIQAAVSDELTAITTGTAKLTFRMPYAMTLLAARASLSTASSSGLPAIDINKNGASIFSTTITIDVSEKTSTTAATAAVITTTAFADDDEITVDIDAAGTGAKGLKIALIGY